MNPFVKRYISFRPVCLCKSDGVFFPLNAIQKFDFSFEEEDSIEGMKKLIVEEVSSFRKEVRAQARAAGQIRRQDR